MAESGTAAITAAFGGVLGDWRGEIGFRLLPADNLQRGPATATLSAAAADHALAMTYTWEHPDDGPQDGVLLVGSPDQGQDQITAAWADSWHQQPPLMTMTGTLRDNRAEISASYGGGAQWVISLERGSVEQLLFTMYNVVPDHATTQEIPSGPYPVMVTRLHRA